MNNTVIDVPAMYADHHVLRVRQALLDTEGVADVVASAAKRKVAVSFDEKTTSAEALGTVLASAGYPPGEMPEMIEFPKRHEDGSAWYTVLNRVTITELKDREMAGDFRRY
jgi:copper chaperone CopZ